MSITVYSKPQCMACTMTIRALDSNGITYTVVNISENASALTYVTEELGYMQAPVVVVNDHDHWSGFRPDHITRIAATGSTPNAA